MMVARLRVPLLVVLVGSVLLSSGPVSAAPTVGGLAADPSTVQINAPTLVTVTIEIRDPSVISTGVLLQRINANGSITNLGAMRDDGTNGDEMAGDRIFTQRITFNETQPGKIRLQASAAFTGVLRRVVSQPLTVAIGVLLPPASGATIPGPGNTTLVVPPQSIDVEIVAAIAPAPLATIVAPVGNLPLAAAVDIMVEATELNGSLLPPAQPLQISVPAPAGTPPGQAFIVAQQALVDSTDGTGLRTGLIATAAAAAVGGNIQTQASVLPGILQGGTYAVVTTVVRPVHITGNASNGVVISETSVGIIVGGEVENNNSTSALVFVGRASRVSIGLGTNNLQAPTIVRNGQGDAIHVTDSANAVIVNTTVTGATNGITVRNGASARIGIDENNVLAGNTITGNRRIGVQISEGASADIGGNTISANGTEGVGSRYGLAVFGAAALLAGGNTIENNPWSGIVASRGSNVIVGATFGAIPTANTIRGNGAAGLANGTSGGVFLFQGSVADIRDATITANHGGGVELFENCAAELNNTDVTASLSLVPGNLDTFHGGQGVVASLGSTVRLRNGSDVSNNAANGILVVSGSVVDFRVDTTSTVNGNGGFGLQCFGNEASFQGDTSGVGPNTSGAISANCTGF